MRKDKHPTVRATARKLDARVVRPVALLPLMIAAFVGAILTALVFIGVRKNQPPPILSTSDLHQQTPPATRLIESLLSAPSFSEATDIAVLNLACCPTLSDPTGKAMDVYLKTLDQWASSVGEVTSKNFHRHLENPAEFGSETEWRLAMLCTVLGQDFKVRYDPTLTSTAQQNASNNQFFANSDSVFLTGCLNGSRAGTCASLPVLYVAIGRRLGYPMYLVTAKGHLFARWDDGKGTRVNLEAANGGGFSSHPDAYYRTWPNSISPQEEQSGSYLKNLSQTETLSIFLSIRATSLQAAGKAQEAITAAAAAYRLAPALGGSIDGLRFAMTGMRQTNIADPQPQPQVASRRSQPRDPRILIPSDPQPGAPYQPQLPVLPSVPGIPQQPNPNSPLPLNPTLPNQQRY